MLRLHTTTKNAMLMHVTTPSVSRTKCTFPTPSSPQSTTVSQSRSLTSLNGRLFTGLSHQRSLPPIHSINGMPSVDPGIYPGLTEFIEIEMKVRDYEVDQYGVVNNAVYSSYCQHAHHELLTSMGVNSLEYGRNQAVAVSDLSFKFLAPLKNTEKFMIKVKVSQSSVARMFIEHFIYKLPNYEPILEAKSTLVWLDKNHRPMRIPSYLKYKLIQAGLFK